MEDFLSGRGGNVMTFMPNKTYQFIYPFGLKPEVLATHDFGVLLDYPVVEKEQGFLSDKEI